MPSSFQVIVKPRGSQCNLRCAYCYSLSKEDPYPGSGFRMSEELLAEFTRQYTAASVGPEVLFTWQGGEPTLMGLEFYQRAVAWQRTCCPPAKYCTNTIQTNGTLLDDTWCRFLREQAFLVGVSLDGPPDLSDAYRRDQAGRLTSGRVLAGLRLLQDWRVETTLLVAVHAANAPFPHHVYCYLRDEVGAHYIRFFPIAEHTGKGLSARSVTAEQYGQFLTGIFDEWVRSDVGRVHVQSFDAALGAWLGQPSSLCAFGETCGQGLVLEHNGDVFACDYYVDPSHCLGNLLETRLVELAHSPGQVRFGLDKRDQLPEECRTCPVRFACQGGCPKDRFYPNNGVPLSSNGSSGNGGTPGLNTLCAGYKTFFTHIDAPMRFMAAELKAGRPAANVMQRRW